MDQTRVHDILNELLKAEATSLLPRLIECAAFVPFSGTGGFEAVQRMASEHKDHTARLAQALIELGGEPGPIVQDIASADFHFVELNVLLPRVADREQQLIATCDAALGQLSDCPPAAGPVGGLAAWHRVTAEYLRKLMGDVALPG